MDGQSKIDISDSGRMLWIRRGEELLAVSGGEGSTTNLLVANGDEASIDLDTRELGALRESLEAWLGIDVVLVDRRVLKELLMAAESAVAVLEAVNSGHPLQVSLQLERASKRLSEGLEAR